MGAGGAGPHGVGGAAVWLDCDPGHDDALALVLAARAARGPAPPRGPRGSPADLGPGAPRRGLLGVSCVAGNQTVARCSANARAVLHWSGAADVPVHSGAGRALVRPPRNCPEIHGETGLDKPGGGPVFPPAPGAGGAGGQAAGGGGGAPPAHGALELAKCLLREGRLRKAAYGGEPGWRPQLVCTGALTNAALALALFPELAELVDVVLMGGAWTGGNTGPAAEFNIQVDPEAAQAVFQSGARVTMVPLEVTHTALATPAVVERIRSRVGGAFGAATQELLAFFAQTYREVFGFEEGPPVHDPCAVLFALEPSAFETKHVRVDVETGASELTAGQTVVDWHGVRKLSPNVHLAVKMDVDKFWERMIDALEEAAGASPLQ